ncbi:hypothetical protein [Dactylosporangium sp. CA-092794]|uniref:hypothetical protein n=1 Tax=Dactylosporangium sp. CA-092794 TaxID=3239929 RepID=UPI003D931A09
MSDSTGPPFSETGASRAAGYAGRPLTGLGATVLRPRAPADPAPCAPADPAPCARAATGPAPGLGADTEAVLAEPGRP